MTRGGTVPWIRHVHDRDSRSDAPDDPPVDRSGQPPHHEDDDYVDDSDERYAGSAWDTWEPW
jgi:hypothetical protein